MAVPFAPSDQEALQKAGRLFHKGEYEQAISQYERLASNEAVAAEANVGLATVFLQVGNYERAEKVCQKALAVSANHPEGLTLLGDVLKHTGRYDEARIRYEQGIAADPAYLPARLKLGVMQWQQGERKQARTTLQYFITTYRMRRNLSPDEIGLTAQACVYLERFRDANTLFFEATKADPNLWQAFVAWGELMLSKYNTADAQSIFEDALKINPHIAEAHLGLAKAFRAASFERATQAAEQALRINPNLVPAHDFLAELQITLGRFEEGLQKLEKPLQINPASLTTRTLRAVAYYFLNNDKKFKEEEVALLEISPKYGELYYQIAEVLAKRYLFEESVEYYRKALLLDPEHWSAHAGLGTSLSRLGRETEARQELEKSFARDPYNKYVGNLLTLFDEFSQYKNHQTKHLTLRIHERDDPVLAPYATELADESFGALLEKYPIETDEEVILEIFPSHDDFAVRCFGLPGAQAFLGICFGNVVAMDSPRARSQGDFVWGETLWHELVHVTHLRLTANRIPRWLAEGIAVYETSLARPYWSMNMDWPFIMAFTHNRTLPLKDLDSGFNRPTSPGQVTLSYFQASLLVEFIVAQYGHDKLVKMFPVFKSGLKTPAVIEAVFGKDIDGFDKEFRRYVTTKYKLDRVDYSYDPHELNIGPEALEKKVSKKPNNPFLNFKAGLYQKEKKDYKKAIAYLQKAKQLFPAYVDKNNPYRVLADIYVELGERRKAIAELEVLTSLNGKNLETLQFLSELCQQGKDYDCAIAALRKALYIAPFESDIHRRLGRVYEAKGEYEAAIRELEINLRTQPQDMAGAHCDLALALLKAGRKHEAKKSALAALEIAPDYERAQEILLASLEPNAR
ncbi:MAG: tetratricopeptide repeat protein [bacterium]